MNLLYWLFRVKNVMPWDVYDRPKGYKDLVYALAQHEMEQRKKA